MLLFKLIMGFYQVFMKRFICLFHKREREATLCSYVLFRYELIYICILLYIYL